MADDRYRNSNDYPSYGRPEERQSQSHRPHPPPHHPFQGPQDQPHRPQHESRPSMATASVSLPSMHDPRGYGQQPAQGSPYPPPDPRYASPNAMNGYPPPGQQAAGYLPPLPPQGNQPPSAYPAPDPNNRRQGAPYPHDRQYPPPAESYYYRHPPGQGPPPQDAYGREYRGPPPVSFTQEYAQHPPPQMAQAAPRQRTSIACKYCRKRKIRCSGYQSAPGGKCQNCARMNQDCVFQPVSSSSSTAFIPVSAVPGGVPPGTQLFGAYGQPLSMPSPGPHQHPSHAYPPPHGHQQGPPAYYHPGPLHQGHPQHAMPTQSPTESTYSYGSTRGDEDSQSGRRRRRTPAEQEESFRLPPPRVGVDDDPQRRSPAQRSTNSSPGSRSYPLHPGPRQSPQGGTAPPGSAHSAARSTSGSHPTASMAGRSPVVRSGSSGATTPSRQMQSFSQPPPNQPSGGHHTPTTAYATTGQYGQSMTQQATGSQSNQAAPANAENASGSGRQSSSVMSLSNLLTEKHDIDRGMINRLNRPPPK